MSKSKSFLAILAPSMTIFVSSACLMILELVAGRLIARYLGSSLYTWTSVIGVVLAGMTIGNYIGGRIADRFRPRKVLSILLGISSVTCVSVVISNNMIYSFWQFLKFLPFPTHVFIHVTGVFLVPSIMLGTISPVVAKMALDQGLATGRTIGNIYAWGAAGSIAGTFLAGFYLIAVIGTTAIIWILAGVLLLMAILYWTRHLLLHVWLIMFLVLLVFGMGPWQWSQTIGAATFLQPEPNPKIIYEDETNYSYIAVERISQSPDKRLLRLDRLKHSEIIMGDIKNLQYPYSQIYAVTTRFLSDVNDKISALTIGGGGYVFPRYIKEVWPDSNVDVVEIDPGVTKAAIEAFGLKRDTSINTFTMDARNYVDDMVYKLRKGTHTTRYDFVYEDAINDFSVPYQLVTKEFNDKVAEILKDDGVYMVNIIDIFRYGLMLGAFTNTLELSFPYVYVISNNKSYTDRRTFVIIGAKQEIDMQKLAKQKYAEKLPLWILSDSEIEPLKTKSKRIVLTDNYAPVENLLAPVVRRGASDEINEEYHRVAEKLKDVGKLEESVAVFQNLAEIIPERRGNTYKEIALIRQQQGQLDKAVDAFKKAIEYNEKTGYIETKANFTADIQLCLGLLFKEMKHHREAQEYFHKAIKEFQKALSRDPDLTSAIAGMGVALAELGQQEEALKYLQRAVNLEPSNAENQFMLAKMLAKQNRYDEAIATLNKAKEVISKEDDEEAFSELQEFLAEVESLKAKADK